MQKQLDGRWFSNHYRTLNIMAELTPDETKVYELIEQARAQYQLYTTTLELPLPQEPSQQDVGNYDWRHSLTICTAGE